MYIIYHSHRVYIECEPRHSMLWLYINCGHVEAAPTGASSVSYYHSVGYKAWDDRLWVSIGSLRFGNQKNDSRRYASCRSQVRFMDLTLPQYWLPQYDWVLSLEVLEHIDGAYETVVLDNIDRAARYGYTWLINIDSYIHFIYCSSLWNVATNPHKYTKASYKVGGAQ